MLIIIKRNIYVTNFAFVNGQERKQEHIERKFDDRCIDRMSTKEALCISLHLQYFRKRLLRSFGPFKITSLHRVFFLNSGLKLIEKRSSMYKAALTSRIIEA